MEEGCAFGHDGTVANDASIIRKPNGDEFVVEIWKPPWGTASISGMASYSGSGHWSRPAGGSMSSVSPFVVGKRSTASGLLHGRPRNSDWKRSPGSLSAQALFRPLVVCRALGARTNG